MKQKLGVAEPGGGDIGGIHAPGNIAEHQQIPAFFFKGQQFGIEKGASAGDNDEKDRCTEQYDPQESAPPGKVYGFR